MTKRNETTLASLRSWCLVQAASESGRAASALSEYAAPNEAVSPCRRSLGDHGARWSARVSPRAHGNCKRTAGATYSSKRGVRGVTPPESEPNTGEIAPFFGEPLMDRRWEKPAELIEPVERFRIMRPVVVGESGMSATPSLENMVSRRAALARYWWLLAE